MPSNEEITQRIINALVLKLGKAPKCPLCGHSNWTTGDQYVVLSTSENPSRMTLGGTVLPLVPLTCQNCGNTHLINLLIIGFTPDDLQSLILGGDGGR